MFFSVWSVLYKLRRNIAKGTADPRVACFHQKFFQVMSQVGQNSALEARPSFSFQISPKLLAQNVDQSLAKKSGPNFRGNLVKLVMHQISFDKIENPCY